MYWVEVLNEALSWSDFDVAARRVAAAGGTLRAAAHGRLVADVALLRRLFAAPYLGLQLADSDRRAALQWVEAVTPRGAAGAATAAAAGLHLGGERQRGGLDAPFEATLTRALLQLLATVNEPLVFDAVHRCHGVQRRDSAPFLSPEFETRFAARAGLREVLTEQHGEPLAQCSRLVVSPRGGRFCSKACNNALFAARKALADPRYFAAKQERYRRRRESEETPRPRPQEGAFVYMD